MPHALQVNRLPLSERLELLEEIVGSMCEQEQDFHSPAWHGEVLRERSAAVHESKDWVDFQDAKKRLRS